MQGVLVEADSVRILAAAWSCCADCWLCSAPLSPRVDVSINVLLSAQIGKMLVYESGAVKMQLGDVLFDVLLGTEAAFRQEIAAVNTDDRACVFLGSVQQRAVACPDINHLLGYTSRLHLPFCVSSLCHALDWQILLNRRIICC